MTDPLAALHVLVPAGADDSAEGAGLAVSLCGASWVLRPWAQLPAETVAQGYVGVSYAWGEARQAHPADAAVTISARAHAVAEAAVACAAPVALWIDAYCLPVDDAARRGVLPGLGAIYAGASRVVAVLSAACAPALDQLARDDYAGLQPDALEADDWVARAWTYQEILNSPRIDFVAQGGSSVVSAVDVLNTLGHFMALRQRAVGNDAFALRALYPRLDAWQEVLADWMTGFPLERPAFRLITGMCGREAVHPDDLADAMLGMLEMAGEVDRRGVAPLEAVLRACEARGDYSFIYAVCARSADAGRSWRPVPPGPLRAPILWHSYGPGQAGALVEGDLQLEHVARLQHGPVSPQAWEGICDWLGLDASARQAPAVNAQTYRRLCNAGFAGPAQAVELAQGLAYFHGRHDDVAQLDVVVPTTLRWVHGAPALLLQALGAGRWTFRDVGVFVGVPPADEESIRLA